MMNNNSEALHPYFQRKPLPAKIGVFAVGLEAYWPQFEGLREELLGYHQQFIDMLQAHGVEVVDGGLSDSPRKAAEVGDTLNRRDVDLLICNVVTYSSSANALPVVQRVGRPVVLVGLQPAAALDYANATTHAQLCNDNSTSLPEICCAIHRANIEIADVIFGKLRDDPHVAARLNQWVRISRCLHSLRKARLGLMGHTYEGMLDMNHDPTMFDGKFGMHVEHIEMDDLQQRVDATGDSAVNERLDLIREIFHFPSPGSDPIAGPVDGDELRWAARVSLGMDKLIEDYAFDGMSYYYKGRDGNANERLGCSLIIGSSLLIGRGVPIAGEYDTKTCVAMLIMDRLGAGGSFAELHPADFNGNFVLVGHDGPHHINIAQGKPVLRGLSVLHGKRGSGPSVEFSIKNGPITIFGITQTCDGQFKFVLAEGESLPGIIPATGNTNTRGKFLPDVRTFLERWSIAGPTHHFALGIGYRAEEIRKLAAVLDIKCELVAQ